MAAKRGQPHGYLESLDKTFRKGTTRTELTGRGIQLTALRARGEASLMRYGCVVAQ